MKPDLNRPGLDLSTRFCRGLLKLHTLRFQEESGDEMLLHHEEDYRSKWDEKGAYGVLIWWIDTLLALIPDVFSEWVEQYQSFRKGIAVKEFLGEFARFISIALMIFAGIAATVFWGDLGANGAFQNGLEQGLWFIVLFDGAIAIVGLVCLAFWKSVAEAID